MTAPNRRWAPLALFVVALSVVALIWVINSLRWMHQRRQFGSRQDVSPYAIHGVVHAPQGKLPLALLLLGEQRRESLAVLVGAPSWKELSDDDCRRAFEARRLFPETRVWFRYQGGGDASLNWVAPLDDLEPYLPFHDL